MSEWISTQDRLPEAEDRDWMGEVIWYLPSQKIVDVVRAPWCDNYMARKATHWKPTGAGLEKPQPPEEDE